VHEIAALVAVLENHRRAIVEEARAENSEHAGIGVGERLVRAVNVEEAQRDDGPVVSAAENQAHALLIVFVEGIDGGERRALRFRRRHRL
jgi:hypothetical protein